jgi:ArsR family metal-binding transcriptional regulator
LSERATSDVSPRDEGLAARVAKLEALLQAQAESAHDSSESRPTVPLMARKSILSVSKSGHVRFTPSPAVDSSREPLQNPQQAIATSIDLSSGPFPFGKKAISISELLDHLPARSHCKQLVDVYYESFASVRSADNKSIFS